MIVYLIRCRMNGRCYVGKTTRSLRVRWNEHRREARHGRRISTLYHEMRKFGVTAFEIELLGEATCSRRLAQMERKFIALYGAAESGYNEACASFGGRIRTRRAEPVTSLPVEQRRKIADSVRASWIERRGVQA